MVIGVASHLAGAGEARGAQHRFYDPHHERAADGVVLLRDVLEDDRAGVSAVLF